MDGDRAARRGVVAVAALVIAAWVWAKPAAADSARLLLASFDGAQDVVQVDVGRLPKWQRVRDWLTSRTAAADPALRGWAAWAAGLRSLPVAARLDAINRRVNAGIRYATDLEVWGVRDYWETPSEVVAKGATDCEGFAIMKLWLAQQAGIDAGSLELLVGILTRSGQMHAVLVAGSGDGPMVLDMLHAEMIRAVAYDGFRPLMAADLGALQLFVGGTPGSAALLASR